MLGLADKAGVIAEFAHAPVDGLADRWCRMGCAAEEPEISP
jgi:hypothetical protein